MPSPRIIRVRSPHLSLRLVCLKPTPLHMRELTKIARASRMMMIYQPMYALPELVLVNVKKKPRHRIAPKAKATT